MQDDKPKRRDQFTYTTLQLENIVEMARTVQFYMDNAHEHNLNFDAFDSRELVAALPSWAVEFDQMYPPEGWNDEEDPHQRYLRGYYTAIDAFMLDKLKNGALSTTISAAS